MFQEKILKKGTLKDRSNVDLQEEQVILKVFMGLIGTLSALLQLGQLKTRLVKGLFFVMFLNFVNIVSVIITA